MRQKGKGKAGNSHTRSQCIKDTGNFHIGKGHMGCSCGFTLILSPSALSTRSSLFHIQGGRREINKPATGIHPGSPAGPSRASRAVEKSPRWEEHTKRPLPPANPLADYRCVTGGPGEFSKNILGLSQEWQHTSIHLEGEWRRSRVQSPLQLRSSRPTGAI